MARNLGLNTVDWLKNSGAKNTDDISKWAQGSKQIQAYISATPARYSDARRMVKTLLLTTAPNSAIHRKASSLLNDLKEVQEQTRKLNESASQRELSRAGERVSKIAQLNTAIQKAVTGIQTDCEDYAKGVKEKYNRDYPEADRGIDDQLATAKEKQAASRKELRNNMMIFGAVATLGPVAAAAATEGILWGSYKAGVAPDPSKLSTPLGSMHNWIQQHSIADSAAGVAGTYMFLTFALAAIIYSLARAASKAKEETFDTHDLNSMQKNYDNAKESNKTADNILNTLATELVNPPPPPAGEVENAAQDAVVGPPQAHQ